MNGLTMKYFVLKPAGDTEYHLASRVAMRAYANAISDANPEFAADLDQWALAEEEAAKNRLYERYDI